LKLGKTIKNEMIKTFILAGIGLIVLLVILYKSVTTFIIDKELKKAELLAHTLVYTRNYLAKVAPYVSIKNPHYFPFATTPAYVVSQISRKLSHNENLFVKQTSDRYRDIKNKPNYYDLQAIKYFQKHKDANSFIGNYYIKNKDGKYEQTLYYAHPLFIEKSCLKCHGDVNEIPKEIYKNIIKYYGKKAFGYKVGDLRGIIAIQIPFQKIKSEINTLFYKIFVFVLLIWVVGVILFLHINANILKDIEKIDMFLSKKLAKNIYQPLKENMIYKEFDLVKSSLNMAIKKLKEYRRNWIKNIYYNELTKLPNRRKLLETLKKKPYPVAVFDIDSFKDLNYFYGEDIANEVILKVAERLKKYHVFHVKIDQFVVIMKEKMTKNEVYDFVKKILKEIEQPYKIKEYEIIINFSAGISYDEKDYFSALSALEYSKMLKKEISFSDETKHLKLKYKDHLIWMKKIRKAIENDKIVPYFQPIVDRDKKTCKYEVLVRLIGEKGEVYTPFYFLDIAKKSRFYFEITKIVIEKSFEKFKNSPYSFSINLTTMDMENDEIKEFILNRLRNYDASRVNFEIVESENIKTSDTAREFLEELKKIGCKILIDDFGSGYANFDYLFSLGADGLKIDGSLIKNILTDRHSQIIVKTIINFAKEADMKVIVEFVENEEIFEYLKDLGAECFQGYYFSPPKEDI